MDGLLPDGALSTIRTIIAAAGSALKAEIKVIFCHNLVCGHKVEQSWKCFEKNDLLFSSRGLEASRAGRDRVF